MFYDKVLPLLWTISIHMRIDLYVVCVKSEKNSIFMKNGKTVICCYSTSEKSQHFLDLG